ncbi:unnamed protein product [Malus baccata var. baccata]
MKPASPTPHYLKTTNLSDFDQLIPDIYVPFLLFYPNNNTDHRSLAAERSKILKTSLSEILTHFYPFAGKFHYNDSICCNDHGVAFLQAQVNCPISKILDKADIGMVKQLLPADMASRQAVTGYLLLVQAYFFECSGMVIGVSIAHKVADVSTISTFIKRWAEIALDLSSRPRTDHQLVLPAEFGVAAFLFPPQDILNAPQPTLEFPKEKCITSRYLFDASKIAALKSKSASATVPNPTRIEVVSPLIWKCAMEASKSKFRSIRPSAWCHTVNMRNLLVRPSAENLLGNLVGKFIAKAGESEVVGLDLQSLVGKLRKGIEEFKVKYANKVTGDAWFRYGIPYRTTPSNISGQALTENILGNFLWYFTSTTMESELDLESLVEKLRKGIEEYKEKYPSGLSSEVILQSLKESGNLLLKDSTENYTSNFGWGKPSWVSTHGSELKNKILLMDMSDGVGIEALLTLKEEDMAIIESNEELLAYASVNPTVI